MHLSDCQSIECYLTIYSSYYPSIFLPVYLSIHPFSIYLHMYIYIYIYIYIYTYLSYHTFISLSIYLPPPPFSGESLESMKGTKTGVYIGVSVTECEVAWMKNWTEADCYMVQGCPHSMFANWISFFFDLRGESQHCSKA